MRNIISSIPILILFSLASCSSPEKKDVEYQKIILGNSKDSLLEQEKNSVQREKENIFEEKESPIIEELSEIEKFQNWLPRCINNCSQYRLMSASYNKKRNEVNVKIKTSYPDGFLATYDKSSLMREEREFWNNYINGKRQSEAMKLNSIKSNYNLKLTMLSSELSAIGTMKIK